MALRIFVKGQKAVTVTTREAQQVVVEAAKAMEPAQRPDEAAMEALNNIVKAKDGPTVEVVQKLVTAMEDDIAAKRAAKKAAAKKKS